MQLLKVIDAFGIQNLQNTKQLKQFLCPVIAQNAAEQQRFYQIFDQYIKEAKILPDEVEEQSPWQSLPKWLRYALPLLLLPLLGLLAYGLHKYFDHDNTAEQLLVNHTQEKEQLTVNDTLRLFNKTNNPDSIPISYQWELLDSKTKEVEQRANSFHWEYIVEDIGASPRKQVRLICTQATGQSDTSQITSFSVLCENAPRIDTFAAPLEVDEGSSLDFKANPLDNRAYSYVWSINGEEFKGKNTRYTFGKTGAYEVVLRASLEADGICEKIVRKTVSVGSVKPPLALKKLEKDKFLPVAEIAYGTWLLIALLSLLAAWLWRSWWQQIQKEEDSEQVDDEKRFATLFKSSDNSPYFIPFRPQRKLIQSEQSLYVFANVLRQRQQGTREEIDVATTLQQTIEQGGFPSIATRFDQKPTQYLFLIDKQTKGSIQARLFDYLREFVENNDVIVERFWYKSEFRQFRNEAYPKGIRKEILLRKYSNYRLVIMGDAHALLDPFAQDEPQLDKELVDIFSKWKDRLLFTPLPPVSWTFREAVLYRLLSMYPADIQGIEDAFNHDFQERAENLQPPYEEWEKSLAQAHPLPDVNYRRWRRLKDYKAYLKAYPEVYTWLCGLAVYPNPTWETTIAIGKVLEPKGVKVTYNNLLILSHIPFLKEALFKPKLRKALLAELDTDTERLARTAIKEELEAVETQLRDSHANLEAQTNLAITNFALDSDNAEYSTQVRYLLENQVFNKKQLEELQWEANKIEKPIPPQLQGMKKAVRPEYYTDIDELLRDKDPKDIAPPRPKRERSKLYKALLATLLPILLLLGALLLNKTDALYQTAFGSSREAAAKESAQGLQHLVFVKETIEADSAAIWNKQAVERWEQGDIVLDNLTVKDSILQLFNNALLFNHEYDLAKSNRDKFLYNYAALQYLEYRKSNEEQYLQKAKGSFPIQSEIDSIQIDALHGEGIVSYYALVAKDTALILHETIIEKNENYYDTLTIKLHLRKLLQNIDTSGKKDSQDIKLVSRNESIKKNIEEGNENNQKNDIENLMNSLHIAYETSDTVAIYNIANLVLKSSKLTKEQLATTNFYIGKISYNQKDFSRALSAFNKVLNNSDNEQTAEAYYLVSSIYYKQNDLEKAKKICIEANRDISNYQYWVAKSVLLLADIFEDQNDLFNSKAALEAVIENFNEDSTIILSAKNKIEIVIKKLEKQARLPYINIQVVDILTNRAIANVNFQIGDTILGKSDSQGRFNFQLTSDAGKQDEVTIALNKVEYQPYTYTTKITDLESLGKKPLLITMKRENEIVKDSDRDGIPDAIDACPNEKGTAVTNGCPDTEIGSINTDENRKTWAMIIGVADYSHMTPLKYTDDDAYRILAFLKSPEGGNLPDKQIRILIDEGATKNNILQSLVDISKLAKKDDLVLLYFSGHGLKGSFLPIDFDGYNNKLTYDEIIQRLDQFETKEKLVILDVCYAGSLLSQNSDNPESTFMVLSNSVNFNKNTSFLLSSKENEVSLESSGLRQGVFSHFMIRGLKGEADYNLDSYVTLGELFSFVKKEVSEYTFFRQTPLLINGKNQDVILSIIN